MLLQKCFRTQADWKKCNSCIWYAKNNGPKTTMFIICAFSNLYQSGCCMWVTINNIKILQINSSPNSNKSCPLYISQMKDAHFTLNGSINIKNSVNCADINLYTVAPIPLYDPKLLCSAQIQAYWFIACTFLEQVTSMVFVRSSLYIAMLQI